MVNAQEWLDANYPKEERHKIKKLNIDKLSRINSVEGIEEELQGELKLEGFVNLEELRCGLHQLTDLDLNDCCQLKELVCSGNQLTNLNLVNLSQLEKLACSGNYLTNLDLSPLNPEKL